MTNQTQTNNSISLDGLSNQEKVAFLGQLGEVVIESALVRLVTGLSDDQQEALDHFLETEPSAEVLMKHLLDHHKDFEKILEEEVKKFQEDTKEFLGG